MEPNIQFIKDTIDSLKFDTNIPKNAKYTKENYTKFDNWFINSNFDPKGIDGRMKLKIISEFSKFTKMEFSFSTTRFIREHGNDLLNELMKIYH